MPNAKLKVVSDFSGAVDSFSAPDLIADNACRKMVNFIPGRAGEPLPLRPGTSMFTPAGPLDDGSVTGLFKYVQRDGSQHWVAVVGAKLLKFDPVASSTQIAATQGVERFLAGDDPYAVVTAKGGLLVSCALQYVSNSETDRVVTVTITEWSGVADLGVIATLDVTVPAQTEGWLPLNPAEVALEADAMYRIQVTDPSDDPDLFFVGAGGYPVDPTGVEYHLTSGILTSKGHAKFGPYGGFTCRAKLPAGGKGIWPAWWLTNDAPEPYGYEIDGFELLGEDPTRLYCSLHDFTHTVVPEDWQVTYAVAGLDDLSPVVWHKETPWGSVENVGELQHYDAANARKDTNRLELLTEHRTVAGMDWASGIATSVPTFLRKYVEITAQAAPGVGILTSVELVDAAGSQYATVFKVDGGDPTTLIIAASDGTSPYGMTVEGLEDLTAAPHKFGMEWTAGYIKWFADDVEVASVAGTSIPTIPLLLTAYSSVGGSQTGAPDGTTPESSSALIDYVRVYATKGAATPSFADEFTGTTTTVDWTADFHTYEIRWFTDHIGWFIDGFMVAAYEGIHTPNQPLWMVLDTAIGGVDSWGGTVDGTTVFPCRMEVEYVSFDSSDSWVPSWRDDFDGTTFDALVWQPLTPWDTQYGTGELMWYTPDALTIEDGRLVITTDAITTNGLNVKLDESFATNNAVTLKTLAAAGDASFTVMNDNLYVANGSEAIVKWDGDAPTASALTNSPTVTMIANVQDRIFAAGNPSYPSRLYYSGVVSKDTSWAGSLADDGGSRDIRIDDGTAITGLAEFMGGVVVFKDHAIYLVTWPDSEGPKVAKVDTLVPGVGCVAHSTIRAYNGTILFLGRDSMGAVAVYQLTTSGVNNIAISIPAELTDITLGAKPHAEIYDNRYHLSFSMMGSAVRDWHLVCDLLRTRWYHFTGFDVRCWGTDPQSDALFFGSGDGTVRRAYSGVTDCGAPIEYEWVWKDFSANNPFSIKRWREVFADVLQTVATLSLGYSNDGGAVTLRRVYSPGGTADLYGAAVYGAAHYGQSATWSHIGFDPNLRSRSFAPALKGSTSEPFAIARVGIAYRDGKTGYLDSSMPPKEG